MSYCSGIERIPHTDEMWNDIWKHSKNPPNGLYCSGIEYHEPNIDVQLEYDSYTSSKYQRELNPKSRVINPEELREFLVPKIENTMLSFSGLHPNEYISESGSDDEYYLPYSRNGFVLYTNTSKTSSEKNAKESVANKQLKMRNFLLRWMRDPYVDDLKFNDICDIHTTTDKKVDLINCVKYAEENHLDIVIPKIQTITSSISDLDTFWNDIFTKDIVVFIPKQSQKDLKFSSIFEYLKGEFLDKMLKIEKHMKKDYDMKRYLDKLDTIGTVKVEKKTVQIGSEDLRVNKGKQAEKWREIYSLLGEIGAYDWICENTGGEEEWNNVNVKDWPINASKLARIFVAMDRFSLWGTKTSITPSIVIRIKINCRYGYKHLSDIFTNRNSKTMLEVDLDIADKSKRRVNLFAEGLSDGKCDEEEKGLFVREMYPEWYINCSDCGKSVYKKAKLKGKCKFCSMTV